VSSQILKSPLPYLALIIAHLIWGGNVVVAKITLQEFPPMTLALLRFAFASLLLAPFFLAETKKVKIDRKDLPKLVAIGVLIITLNITFFFEGIRRTTAIDASILSLSVPMLSVLFGWWFLKEKVYLVNIGGIGLGLIGALIILGLPNLFTGSIAPEKLSGNILILLSSTVWVIGAVLSSKILTKYSSLVVTAVAFLVGTVTFFIPAALEYIQNPGWVSQITTLGILGLAYMTLLSSISAFFLMEWGLSKTSLITADFFKYIEPLVVTALAVTILAEKPSGQFWIGAGLIAIGAYLGTLAKEAHHRHHKAHRV
jgi:drug/metabolite transporter (DMT)-like permease